MQAWYKLSDYITAESQYRNLKAMYLQERDRILSSTEPQFDISLGWYVKESLSVEKAAIYLLEEEEQFKQDIQPLYDDRKKLYEALKVLTYQEQQAFFNLSLGVKVSLSDSLIKKIEKAVVSKLCKYIELHHLEKGA